MSDLQEIIANTSIKAFNEGVCRERDMILNFLSKTKEATKCECENCQSWKNAFDWLMTEITNEQNSKAL
jgi:hypothetical protein